MSVGQGAWHNYLIGTAYAGTASTNFTTNLSRWLKDYSANAKNANSQFTILRKQG